MTNFIKLCEIIIDTKGNPTAHDVLSCGYEMDHFFRMSISNITPERLVKNARQALLDRGIHYKEKTI